MQARQPGESVVETETELIRQALEKSLDYPRYRELVASQARSGRTSGPVQSESLIHYTLLNHQRMNRWEKKIELPSPLREELRSLSEPITWLVLTESWCGDAAPVLPVMAAFSRAGKNLELRIAFRDENLPLMDRFLTGGSRAIPKLLEVRPGDYSVRASWGPRPAEPMRMADAHKARYGTLSPEFRESLQRWYNQDRGRAIIGELASLLGLE
ncbi:thioredoxin family protein [Robiginitalea marina]|uniref:Thioredoxin family protein n=1 Tax=Robiginitalea marina TaxID=2954105 RepID=A0ABT1AY46_9FLAO|nr:thioredoxin family protein [Robiginitalea marina]MCO5724545.1 thioredoxin family protein [Robiginitalea marina]